MSVDYVSVLFQNRSASALSSIPYGVLLGRRDSQYQFPAGFERFLEGTYVVDQFDYNRALAWASFNRQVIPVVNRFGKFIPYTTKIVGGGALASLTSGQPVGLTQKPSVKTVSPVSSYASLKSKSSVSSVGTVKAGPGKLVQKPVVPVTVKKKKSQAPVAQVSVNNKNSHVKIGKAPKTAKYYSWAGAYLTEKDLPYFYGCEYYTNGKVRYGSVTYNGSIVDENALIRFYKPLPNPGSATVVVQTSRVKQVQFVYAESERWKYYSGGYMMGHQVDLFTTGVGPISAISDANGFVIESSLHVRGRLYDQVQKIQINDIARSAGL